MHRNLFDLDCPQIFGQAGCKIIGAALRVRMTGILIFPIELETPYGHLPRSMGRQGLAAVDDLADLLRRKNAAMTVSNAREVGYLNLETLRNGPIAAALIAMAAGAKALVQLDTGGAGEILRTRRDGCQDEQDQGNDNRQETMSGMSIHLSPQ
jgi:hypothetical protein